MVADGLIAVALIYVAFYFVPTVVAIARRIAIPDILFVFVTNLVGGWKWLGWIAMWRVDDDLGGRGDSAPPLPNGAKGYLYESGSDADVADWGIVWSDPLEDGCNQTALTLFLPSLSKAEGRREILHVAESLVPLT
jgi:hypothetical protein